MNRENRTEQRDRDRPRGYERKDRREDEKSVRNQERGSRRREERSDESYNRRSYDSDRRYRDEFGRDSRRDDKRIDERNARKEDDRDRKRWSDRTVRSRSPHGHRASRHDGGGSHSGSEEPIEIEKPCYVPSGLLARERNTYSETRGTTSIDKLSATRVVLKYNEPADAAPFAPSLRQKQTQYGKNTQFRLICFKQGSDGDEESIRLDQLTSYLIGTDERIVKIPLPDASEADEQHAVIQYRVKTFTDKYGDTHRSIKPYLIDLDSKRGTKLNGDKIPSLRYIELRNKDMLQFGRSKDEYIFLEER